MPAGLRVSRCCPFEPKGAVCIEWLDVLNDDMISYAPGSGVVLLVAMSQRRLVLLKKLCPPFRARQFMLLLAVSATPGAAGERGLSAPGSPVVLIASGAGMRRVPESAHGDGFRDSVFPSLIRQIGRKVGDASIHAHSRRQTPQQMQSAPPPRSPSAYASRLPDTRTASQASSSGPAPFHSNPAVAPHFSVRN